MKHILLASLFLVALAGCAAETSTTEGSEIQPTTGTSSNAPANTPEATPATNPEATADMGNCEQCGMQVAKVELVSHDGKMLCSHCIEAHDH